MGKLLYDSEERPIVLDDRTLAHLKIVIITKLRRMESFTVSWKHPDNQPAGRSTIWVHPSIPLQFVFDDAEPPTINQRWIHELMQSANTSGGISLVDEVTDGPD
jgi:hypothetical protein